MPEPSRIEEILLRIVATDDDADQKLSAVERRLRALNDQRARARVEIDDAASSRIEEIRAELRRLGQEHARPTVTLADGDARARILELQRELARLGGTRHVRVDVSGAGGGGVSSSLERIKTEMGEIGQRASSIPRWIGATLPLTIPLAGTLAQAAAGAGLLGVAAAGAGAAFGALGIAAKMGLGSQAQLTQAATAQRSAQTQLTAAIKSGDQARIAAARNQLAQAQDDVRSAEQQQAAWQTTTNAVKNGWQNVQQAFMAAAGPGARTMLAGLVTSMRTVTSALGGTKGAFSVLGAAVRDALASPQTQDGIRQLVSGFAGLVRASAPLAGPIVQGLLDLGRIFVNLARAAMPALIRVVQDLVRWLDRMVNLTGDQSKLVPWVNRMIASLGAVWHVVVDLAKALGQLFNSQIASGALAVLDLFAKLLGLVIQLTNHLGPLGQLIGAGLGILLLVGRFRSLFVIIGGVIGVVRGLERALLGLAGARMLGGGAGGLLGFFRSLRDRIRGVGSAVEEEGRKSTTAAGQNEEFAKSKQNVEQAALGAGGAVSQLGAAESGEGALAGTAAQAIGQRGAQSSLVARILGALRSRVGVTGLGGAAAGAGAAALGGGNPLSIVLGGLGGGAGFARGLSVPMATAIGSSVGLLSAAIEHWKGPLSAAMKTAWQGAVNAISGQPVAAAVNRAMNQGTAAIRGHAGPVHTAALSVWQQIANAARSVNVRPQITATMRGGEQAIRSASAGVRSIANSVWRGLALGASSQTGPVRAGVNQAMRGGEAAVRGGAGAVRSAALGAWRGIATAASAQTGAVRSAVNQTMRGGEAAIRAGGPAVHANATSTWRMIATAARTVSGDVNGAITGLMGHGRQAVANAAPAVHGASRDTWSRIHQAATAESGPVRGAVSGAMREGYRGVSDAGPPIASKARDVFNGIKAAVDWVAPKVLGATKDLLGGQLPFGIEGATSKVGAASRGMLKQGVEAPMEEMAPAASVAGGRIDAALASGITANASVVQSAVYAVTQAAANTLPASEPRDPASPLRGLPHRGRMMMEMFARGITGAPVRTALQHALVDGLTPLTRLPTAGLPHLAVPITLAGQQAALAGAGTTNIVHVHVDPSLHPADPATLRRVASTVSTAMRRSHPQTPPVNA